MAAEADASAVLSVVSPSPKNAEPAEDQDLLLARALQEQEHAYAMLYGGLGGYGAYDNGASSDYEGEEGEGDAAADPTAGANAGGAPVSDGSERTAQTAGAGSASASASASGADEAAPSGEEGDDEALARRLHAEEQRDLYRRMLEMSGYHQMAEAEEDGHQMAEAVDEMSYEDLQVLGEVVGVVSRGLSADAIAALPSVTLAQLHQAASSSGGGAAAGAAEGLCGSSSGGSGAGAPAVEAPHRCTICLVDLEADDVLKLLPCRHAYHSECLDTWLGINKNCPVCTAEVEARPVPLEEQQGA
ncbi:hypothetical protein Rsub_11156 [Raphidocelis subcapitata]|uniref:RING-type domain-containing protein n=1 Tax=Raphidocelis subcapitata TaxID=307507 RepID=A0A2V0PLN0_9CHLO|nr:hypothetical protein Rsub_11156 [Raphidocelis subcapitata]|eukprot:GBF98750.1 hypothetical protein Rsub_11156 [Raphidocelis subcapitata]